MIDKTVGLHPNLLAKLHLVLAGMAAIGHPMKITDGVRTVAQQQVLYAKGRTTPGPRVTNCDGITTRSNHQIHSDGFGHAADCCFQGVAPYPKNDKLWAAYGALVEAVELKWGGHFTTRFDGPHAELPPLA